MALAKPCTTSRQLEEGTACEHDPARAGFLARRPCGGGSVAMKASMVLAAALATGLLGSFRVVAEAAPACRGGRFLVEGPPLIGATPNGEPDAVVIDAIRVSPTRRCGATSGRIRVAKRRTKVNAVWPSCGGLRGKARLKARIDPTGNTMTGTLRARREKWKRSFSAELSECGDGIVDIDGGEECDPPGTVACDEIGRAHV